MANALPLLPGVEDAAEPVTADDWRRHIGKLLVVRQRSDQRPYNPGSTLMGVEGSSAIIRPAGHGRTERVPLADIRLWKKGNAQREQIEESRMERLQLRPSKKSKPSADRMTATEIIDTRIEKAEDATDGWTVVRDASSGLYLAKSGKTHSFCVPLKFATAWEKYNAAQQCVSFARRNHGLIANRGGFEYMTVAQARALEARLPTSAPPEPPRAQEPVPVPEPIQFPSHSVPEAVEIETEPAPTSAPPEPPRGPLPATMPTMTEIAAQARLQNVWTEWRSALLDEAAAKGMHLEATAKLLVAEAKVRIEQQRSDWNLP